MGHFTCTWRLLVTREQLAASSHFRSSRNLPSHILSLVILGGKRKGGGGGCTEKPGVLESASNSGPKGSPHTFEGSQFFQTQDTPFLIS